jgi:hypothetical protein
MLTRSMAFPSSRMAMASTSNPASVYLSRGGAGGSGRPRAVKVDASDTAAPLVVPRLLARAPVVDLAAGLHDAHELADLEVEFVLKLFERPLGRRRRLVGCLGRGVGERRERCRRVDRRKPVLEEDQRQSQ